MIHFYCPQFSALENHKENHFTSYIKKGHLLTIGVTNKCRCFVVNIAILLLHTWISDKQVLQR